MANDGNIQTIVDAVDDDALIIALTQRGYVVVKPNNDAQFEKLIRFIKSIAEQ